MNGRRAKRAVVSDGPSVGLGPGRVPGCGGGVRGGGRRDRGRVRGDGDGRPGPARLEPDRFEQYFEVGNTLLFSLGFDESLAPAGFEGPGMETSFFEHPTPNFGRGMRVRVGQYEFVARDHLEVQRVERASDGEDFVMSTIGTFEDISPHRTGLVASVDVELRLEALAAPVDYTTLPDPLVPVVPSVSNRLIISADATFRPACADPGDCVVIAEIDTFAPGVDSDGDGILDSQDNCVDLPNGPYASVHGCSATVMAISTAMAILATRTCTTTAPPGWTTLQGCGMPPGCPSSRLRTIATT